jgi:heat shock protein HslJ
MKKVIVLLSVFFALIFLYSCKCTKSCCASKCDASKNLNGTWELSFISGPRIAFDGLYPDKKPQMTFNLPDSVVTGNTSCNSFRSTTTIKGNAISFAPGATTKMFCEGAGEPTFLKMLQDIDSYSTPDAKTLELSGNKIILMRFTKK